MSVFHDFMQYTILSTSVCTNSINFVISKGVGERWEGSWREAWILESFKQSWSMSSIDSREYLLPNFITLFMGENWYTLYHLLQTLTIFSYCQHKTFVGYRLFSSSSLWYEHSSKSYRSIQYSKVKIHPLQTIQSGIYIS